MKVLINALKACYGKFDDYRRYHLKKGTEDSLHKAYVNKTMLDIIDMALRGLSHPNSHPELKILSSDLVPEKIYQYADFAKQTTYLMISDYRKRSYVTATGFELRHAVIYDTTKSKLVYAYDDNDVSQPLVIGDYYNVDIVYIKDGVHYIVVGDKQTRAMTDVLESRIIHHAMSV